MRLIQMSFSLLLLSTSLVAALTVLHPVIRNTIRDNLSRPHRKVLSIVEGDIFGTGTLVQVLKVQTEKGLYLEVYGDSVNNVGRPLLEKIQLPDVRDGYFHFRGQAANLALDDIDEDRRLEIIAPSFDDNLIAHLNIYRYNPGQARLEMVTQEPL